MVTSVSRLEHLKAIVLLPFMVTVMVPLLIVLSERPSIIQLDSRPYPVMLIIGAMSLAAGMVVFILAVNLFSRVGIGTLAPWNPPENLVVTGLYSHVRNPMLIGIICILLGETFLAQSGNILIWTTLLFILINIGFVLKEEPDLVDRFGEEYEEYRRYVPRWIPRLKGWSPEKQSTNQL